MLDETRDKRDLEVLEEALWRQYRKGYFMRNQFLPPPTYQFLSNVGLFHEREVLQKIVEDAGYDSHTRFVYGFFMEMGEIEREKTYILQKRKL